MANYNRGKIYTIRYKLDHSLIYVGSTTGTINHRWNQHKWDCQNNPKCPLHYKINETNDIDNWYVELYELYPSNTRKELIDREVEITKQIATLNFRIENRSRAEAQRQRRTRNKKSNLIIE